MEYLRPMGTEVPGLRTLLDLYSLYLFIWLFICILYPILYNKGKCKCFSKFCEPLQQIIEPEERVMGMPDF